MKGERIRWISVLLSNQRVIQQQLTMLCFREPGSEKKKKKKVKKADKIESSFPDADMLDIGKFKLIAYFENVRVV